MEQNYKLLMKTAILAGEILLSSGAETYRVEDTMKHILNKSGLETVETFAVLTGIMATLDDESIETISYVKQVSDVGMNINKIIMVNDIARKFCEDELTLEEAYTQLRNYKWRQYTKLHYSVAVIGIVVGFSIFFGGSPLDVGVSFFVGSVLALLMALGKQLGFNDLIYIIVNGMGIAICTMLAQAFLPEVNKEIVMISSIMPLVPGVALTNGVRDILQGDYISGNSRILKAILTAAGIAIGIGLGLLIVSTVGI